MVTTPLFYILLALRGGERHGYQILKDVRAGSPGKISLGPATLYTSLKKLLDAGLVQEVEGPGDPRRRYYRLTRSGRRQLDDELDRMEQAIAVARPRRARAAT